MPQDRAHTTLPLLSRDLIVAISGRESFESTLDAIARRRIAVYRNPRGVAVEALYWVVYATAVAPAAPPAWMPMSGLIEHGFTLEGGAKGLRALFSREPSEKERRRVLRTAVLASRLMELVAGTTDDQTPRDEQRLTDMAMASFGLSPDEQAQTRSPGPVSPDLLEVHGELDTRIRRELLRGAWQLALAAEVDDAQDKTLRAIAARLEMSVECDAVRAEVAAQMVRQWEAAATAVELARAALRDVPPEASRPWLEHLVATAAPLARKSELLSVALGVGPTRLDALPRLDTARRRQAVALALATVLAHDPTLSASLQMRAEISAGAVTIGAAGEIGEAFSAVDRYLFDRTRETYQAPAEPPAAPTPPTTPPAGTRTA